MAEIRKQRRDKNARMRYQIKRVDIRRLQLTVDLEFLVHAVSRKLDTLFIDHKTRRN